jgi:hypothetical protein
MGEGKTLKLRMYLKNCSCRKKVGPNYYVALVNTTTAFKTKDKDQMNLLLSKHKSIGHRNGKNPNNAELLVVQAMIHTAWIAFDPMTNGQKLSGTVMQLWQSTGNAPENPRVVYNKAEFEIGG